MDAQPSYKKRGRVPKRRENIQGTSMLTLRVPNEIYNQFVDYCNSIGRSLNVVGIHALSEIMEKDGDSLPMRLGPERDE